MKTRKRLYQYAWLLATALAWPLAAMGQVPVDENGNPVGEAQSANVVAEEELTILPAGELEELIGPIALYPDELLAIVLPASTYPLQIVEAARFLEDLESDASLKPDEDWDDSVVALTNYPEVVKMMSEDLDWTLKLGEAVVAQQTDVIKAIESFRDRAYAAGNLKSDDFQNVTEDDGVISITPVEEEVIYVPYYEPERVVVYQPRPVYYYYPRPYPVYYYPYPAGYSFSLGYFWGVTTAFTIGWHTHHLHTWHSSYYGHPYYGRTYWYNNWWYRRPNINVYNNYYVHNTYNSSYDRYRRGDYWQPNTRRTVRSTDQRITRTRYYPGTDGGTRTGTAATFSRSNSLARDVGNSRTPVSRTVDKRQPITFRERTGTATRSQTTLQPRNATGARSGSAPVSTSRPSTVKPSTSRSGSVASAISRGNSVPPSAVRPSTTQSSANRSERLSRLNLGSTARQGFAQSSTPQPSASRSSVPRTTYSRPSTPSSPFSRSSTPNQSFSRPSTPSPSYSRPSTPSQSFSRSSTPRQSISRPAPSKASQPRSISKSSASKASGSSSRSASRNSADRRQR